MTEPREPSDHPGDGVRALVAGVRRHLLGRAILAGFLWILVLVTVGLFVGWILAGSGGWSRASPMPLALDAGLVLGLAATLLYLSRRFGRLLAPPRLAVGLDEVGGFGRGTVLGALELEEELPPGVSPGLARRAEASVAGRLAASGGGIDALSRPLSDPFERSVRRAALLLAVAAPGLAALGVLSPERSIGAWGGMLRPTAVLASPSLPPLEVIPGGGTLPRGEGLQVRVVAPERERVRLRWRYEGDVERTARSPVVDGRASFDLGPLDAPVAYRALAPDGATSEWIRLVPEDPLLLTDLLLEVVSPPYTGRGVRRFERPLPPIEVPEGSRIRVRGRASRTLGVAALRPASEDGTDAAVRFDVEGDGFEGAWTPRNGGRFQWELSTRDGETPPDAPPPLEVRLVADSTPSVELTFPGRDTLLPLDRRQPLVARATDDYGIRRMTLEAYLVSSGERGSLVTRELDTRELRAVVARPVLDVSGWDLLPGDTVRYRIRVEDNAPAARSAVTPEFVLRVARRTDAARVVQERLQGIARAADSLASEAARSAEDSRELRRRALERREQQADGTSSAASAATGASATTPRGETPESSEGSFEGREEARAALERQERLLGGVDTLQSRLDEIRRNLDRAALADADLRRDLDELRSLMDRVSPESGREELRRDRDRLDEMDAPELDDALSRLAEEQDALRRRIEDSLDRFRRAAADQDLRASAREARDLADAAEREADRAEAMEEGDGADERAGRQEELAERAEGLGQRMDSLRSRMEDVGEPAARSGVREAAERSGDAAERMERAAQMSRAERGRDAASEARSAADQLRRSADELDRSRQGMAERREDRLRDAFERTASEALALARHQEELGDRMRGADRDERARVQGDQAAVLEGMQNLSEALARPAAESPQTGGEVRDAVEQAREAVEQALEALSNERSGGTPTPSSASSQAVRALNSAARRAGRAARQPGAGDGATPAPIQEALREVAGRQGELAERSGAESAETGPGGRGERTGELAREQGSVAGELGELARRPESNALLGDLQRLEEEARELSSLLEEGRLDPETVRRQERLFHRLLDAGRSLESDERSDERESTTAGAFSPAEVEPLSPDVLEANRFGVPSAEVLQGLLPAQRALVLRYFERLNRSTERDRGIAR